MGPTRPQSPVSVGPRGAPRRRRRPRQRRLQGDTSTKLQRADTVHSRWHFGLESKRKRLHLLLQLLVFGDALREEVVAVAGMEAPRQVGGRLAEPRPQRRHLITAVFPM